MFHTEQSRKPKICSHWQRKKYIKIAQWLFLSTLLCSVHFFLHYHIFIVRSKKQKKKLLESYVDDEDNDDELDVEKKLYCCCRRRLFALLCSQIPTLLRKFNGNIQLEYTTHLYRIHINLINVYTFLYTLHIQANLHTYTHINITYQKCTHAKRNFTEM